MKPEGEEGPAWAGGQEMEDDQGGGEKRENIEKTGICKVEEGDPVTQQSDECNKTALPLLRLSKKNDKH